MSKGTVCFKDGTEEEIISFLYLGEAESSQKAL